MTLKEQLDAKQAEYDKVSDTIATMEPGEFRKHLKTRRAALTGEMVTLRQQIILECVAEFDKTGIVPERPARLKFGANS